MRFLKNLGELVRLVQRPPAQRQLVFYCENKNYWVHLEGLIREVLATSEIPVCFISSDPNDPGLSVEHPRFHAFQTDEGWIRSWLFENIEADVMVMTMPDLHQYQVKKSRHPVHYIYVQHSLVSLHMAYRPGAFDHFDTVFCAGPHHVREVRALEKAGGLIAKNVVEHGYGRFDSILDAAAELPRREKSSTDPIHVLIAPSWGPQGVIETLGETIVGVLLAAGLRVTLRPHPQTTKFSKSILDDIEAKHGADSKFSMERDVAGQESLHQADLMVSDWSGAALEFGLGLGKPVLFIDVPRKVNNPDYEALQITPLEDSIRKEIGRIVSVEKVVSLPQIVEEVCAEEVDFEALRGSNVFSLGDSDRVGAAAILACVEDVQNAKNSGEMNRVSEDS